MNPGNDSVSIVIPCFNEESAIPIVMKKIAEVRLIMPNILEVIIVDDGSTDRSFEVLNQYSGIKILRNEKSQGYGAALKKGFREAQGNFILFMDMDDTYDIQDTPQMYDLLLKRKNGVVFGNRLAEKNGMPRIRRIGNIFYHYCLKIFMLPHVGDPCTGMRIFRRQYIEAFCRLPENDLSYSIALTVYILKSQIPFSETRILYHERIGESKLNSFQDGWRFLWSLMINRLSV